MNLVRGGAVPGTVRARHCDTPSIVLRGRAPASERNVGSQSTSCSIRSVVRPRTATGSAPPERNAVTLVPPSKLPKRSSFSHVPCTEGQHAGVRVQGHIGGLTACTCRHGAASCAPTSPGCPHCPRETWPATTLRPTVDAQTRQAHEQCSACGTHTKSVSSHRPRASMCDVTWYTASSRAPTIPQKILRFASVTWLHLAAYSAGDCSGSCTD